MGCSGDQKVTVMVLKVDLQCRDCYKKVKKTLCRFPQIRDQVYDEKNNTVTITVVCCSPEKIRDKLCSKGGKSIQSIEIKEPKKPDAKKPEDKPKPAPAPEKPKQAPPPAAEPEKPKPKPAPEAAPAPAPAEKVQKNGSKNGSKKEAPAAEAAKAKPAEEAPKAGPPAPAPTKPEAHLAQWVPGFPPQGPPPQQVQAMCCTPCYEGIPGGPCYQGQGYGYGYGYGYPPGPSYGYSSYGRPPCPPGYSYNNNGRCDYFSEENPAGCWIM